MSIHSEPKGKSFQVLPATYSSANVARKGKEKLSFVKTLRMSAYFVSVILNNALRFEARAPCNSGRKGTYIVVEL